MITWPYLDTIKNYIKDISHKAKSLTIKDNVSDDEIILANLACLTEETWELASEVRKHFKMSFSKKKVAAYTQEDLEDEAIDVLITLWLLLESIWIENLDDAILRKIWKNNDRWYT